MDMKSKLEQEKECKLKFSKESLCSFLNSSVNIEYVYLILTGIQKFMINSIENYESTNGTERQNSIVSKMSSARKMKAEKLIIKKNKNKTVIDMVGINIDNTEDQWNVDRKLSISTGYTQNVGSAFGSGMGGSAGGGSNMFLNNLVSRQQQNPNQLGIGNIMLAAPNNPLKGINK